jgi:spore coat polysaccharide biosynthesis protein SpsF (cytidylyltransferase family)
MDIAGRPMIDHVIERALAINGVDKVVLNVPERDVSHFLHVREQYPHENSYAIIGIPNQEQDVLGSYLTCAVAEKADVIVRLTGDCPFLAPELVETALEAWRELDQTERARFYLPLCMPYVHVADGWDAEVFSLAVLREAAAQARPDQREHVTGWMREHAVVYRIPSASDWTALKCSVDTQADLDRARLIHLHLYKDTDFSHIATWEAWQRAGKP